MKCRDQIQREVYEAHRC